MEEMEYGIGYLDGQGEFQIDSLDTYGIRTGESVPAFALRTGQLRKGEKLMQRRVVKQYGEWEEAQ